jgi:predicted lipoprotein
MSPSHRRLGTSTLALSVLAGAVIVGVSAVAAACTSTTDRGGASASSGGASSSSGASSSGGIDAEAPAGSIECGPAPGAAAPFTKQALLEAASDCAAWHACTFLNAATALRSKVRDHAASPSEDALVAVRDAWKAAMNEWSKMELFQFGPVGSTTIDKYHGRGLRSFVHPWPQVSRCEVEKQVATKEWQQQGIGKVALNGRGLFALEYLFFYAGSDTVCLPASPAGQAWSALGPAELAKAKSDYATAVADNVVAVALEIRNVWLPEGENFKAKILAFEGYGTEQEALNVVATPLYYVEKEIKDLKLASLAGVQATPPNPETPFALVEIENIRTNLRAFRSLFQGCADDGTGVGFDDWLTAVGHGQISNAILAALGNAQAAADAFPPFSQATPEQFKELYALIRELTNLLKTQLFGSASPLNLRLPSGVPSDTD